MIIFSNLCYGHDGDISEHALSVFQHSHRAGEGNHYDLPHAGEEHAALAPNGLIPGCEGLHNHITSELKESEPKLLDETPQKPTPQQRIIPTQTQTEEKTDTESSTQDQTDSSLVSRTSRQDDGQDTVTANILKITHISYQRVVGRGGRTTNAVLTLQLTAYTPDTEHNGLVIRVDGYDYLTPHAFFGTELLSKGEIRTVSLLSRPRNNGVFMKTPASSLWVRGQKSWQTIERFDIDDFRVVLVGRDAVTHADFDADGNRIGYTAGAPSLQKRKLTTMWARLKQTQ